MPCFLSLVLDNPPKSTIIHVLFGDRFGDNTRLSPSEADPIRRQPHRGPNHNQPLQQVRPWLLPILLSLLNDKTIASIRDALPLGLAAFGETEHLSNAQQIQVQRVSPVDQDLQVIQATGASDTIFRFADVLRALG